MLKDDEKGRIVIDLKPNTWMSPEDRRCGSEGKKGLKTGCVCVFFFCFVVSVSFIYFLFISLLVLICCCIFVFVLSVIAREIDLRETIDWLFTNRHHEGEICGARFV